MILCWRLLIPLQHIYISPAARGEPVCRRVSRDFCGDLVGLQAERKGGDFVLTSFQQVFTMNIFPQLHGGNRFAGGSLETFAAILVRLQAEREGDDFVLASFQQFYTMYISPRLRGGNRFSGGSLETFAVIVVRLQAERKGDDFVLASFNKFTPGIFFAGCAGRTGLPATI